MTTSAPNDAALTSTNDKNDQLEIFGWKMYDWANYAFYTTVVGALFSPYLTRLAQSFLPRRRIYRNGSLVILLAGGGGIC